MFFRSAAAAAAALALAGCSTTSADNATKILNTLATTYAHCHHTVNYSATVGAMNPGSGASVQGQIDCPAIPIGPDGKPLPAPAPVTP